MGACGFLCRGVHVDRAAERLLKQTGWTMPDPDRDPTGQQLIDDYLAPLSALPAIASNIRYGAKVTAVTRQGMDRVPSKGREQRAFEISVNGTERVAASAVIDASGTWSAPNPAGANGIPALGEKEVHPASAREFPMFRAERKRYAGKRVVVMGPSLGDGSILNLARLKKVEPKTKSSGLCARTIEKTFGGGAADSFQSRGVGRARQGHDSHGNVSVEAPFRVHGFALRKTR